VAAADPGLKFRGAIKFNLDPRERLACSLDLMDGARDGIRQVADDGLMLAALLSHLEGVVVLLLVRLDLGREIERHDTNRLHHRGQKGAPDAAVAVTEGMDRFEMGMCAAIRTTRPESAPHHPRSANAPAAQMGRS
jgi:hypothetical protein